MYQRKNSMIYPNSRKTWSTSTATINKENFNSNGGTNSGQSSSSVSSQTKKRLFEEDEADDDENNANFDSVDSENVTIQSVNLSKVIKFLFTYFFSICLSIFHHGGKLGASYFEGGTKFLFVLEDVEESCDTFPMFQNRKKSMKIY